MYPAIEVSIFGITGQLFSYTLLVAAGAVILFLGLEVSGSSQALAQRDREGHIKLLGWCIALGTFGAALGAQLLSGDQRIPLTTVTVMPGLIAAAAAAVLAGTALQVNARSFIELILPWFCTAHALGRIGCFLAGCCFGHPTNFATGVMFPAGSPPSLEHGLVHVHPSQLYEAGALFGLALCLFSVTPGRRLPIYLIGYGVSRFSIELTRGGYRGSLLNGFDLSPSQIWSILFVLVGVVIFLSSVVPKKHRH